MADYRKNKEMKIAAWAVIAALLTGLGGALLVESGLGLVLILALEAIILIGAGIILGRLKDEGR